MGNDTSPKLMTWVVRTADINSMVKGCSDFIGEVESMSRGEARWLITISKDGKLPLDAGAPALIQWQVDSHPATQLMDYGLSLNKLQIFHPEPERLSDFFAFHSAERTC